MVFKKSLIREDNNVESMVTAALQQVIINSRREAARSAAIALADIALDVYKYVRDKAESIEEAKKIFEVIWSDVADAAKYVLFLGPSGGEEE